MISLPKGLRSVVLGLAFVTVPLHADMVTAVKAREIVQKLSAEARNMLEADDFEGLDKKAEEFEKSRAHNESGVWMIRQFSNALSRPTGNSPGEEEWTDRLNRLQAWADKSNTPFSMGVLAAAEIGFGYAVRGDGPDKAVDENRKKYFEGILAKAEETLLIARNRNPDEVDLYRHLLAVGVGRNWPRERMEETLKQGIAVAPDYYDNYVNMATYLLERWHGQPGDWQRFMNTIPTLVPGDEGFMAYARTATEMVPNLNSLPELLGPDDNKDRLSWPKIKLGYQALNRAFPDSGMNLNRMARMAFVAGDRDTAKIVLKTLDEHDAINPTEWGGQAGLADARKTLGGE
jgi:hypothetical protein